jgi:drug/metabolite transporter (DMT)-like permease
VAAVVLALAAAAAWGTGDFFGGLASRRTHVLTVLALSLLIGLAGVLIWLVASGDGWPGWSNAAPAAGAGLAGAVGLGCLYRGLAIGAMGIVAPISAMAPVVPLAVDAAQGQVPAALQWAGIALALAGIMLVSLAPSSATTRTAAGVGLATVAALGFGLFIVGVAGAADESVPWAIAIARGTGVATVLAAVLWAGVRPVPPASLLPMIVAVGVFDTGATIMVALATTKGLTGVVAVLSSLYPLVTVLLARIVLAEHLSARRRTGGLVALAGAGLIAAG